MRFKIAILKTLSKRGIHTHVPELYRSKKRKRFDYMIVTLLGENFRTLRVNNMVSSAIYGVYLLR